MYVYVLLEPAIINKYLYKDYLQLIKNESICRILFNIIHNIFSKITAHKTYKKDFTCYGT